LTANSRQQLLMSAVCWQVCGPAPATFTKESLFSIRVQLHSQFTHLAPRNRCWRPLS